MEIDQNLSPIEIHRSIYESVLSLGLKRRFKSRDDFESKWYRDATDGPFILFPHPSIDDPDDAINGCAYPNVWIRHNPEKGELEYGIAFWSAPSVDQRFVNFAHNKNENQRTRVLTLLKELPETWRFQVFKKKRHGQDEMVFENKCNRMGQSEIMKVISDVLAWRIEWKKAPTERGNWATPAINLMRGASAPTESDKRIVELFNTFDEIAEMTPSKKIQEDSKKARKEISAQIENLEKNKAKSNYKTEIEFRIRNLKQDLEKV